MASNKEIAWSYFSLINDGKIDEALDLLHDSGTWWSNAPRKAIPMMTQKATAGAIMRTISMRFTLLDAIEEGDKVAVEIESRATVEDGAEYNNIYVFIMTISQGKILHVREHADTRHAAENLPAKAREIEVERFTRHHANYYPS